MTQAEQQYELLKNLTLLAEKTKSNSLSHGGKLALYFTLELACYFIFFVLLCFAFYLPDYLSVALNPNNQVEITVLVTSNLWKQSMLFLKILFLFSSLFPFIVGLLIRRSRRKSQLLYEIHIVIKNTIKIITHPTNENG